MLKFRGRARARGSSGENGTNPFGAARVFWPAVSLVVSILWLYTWYTCKKTPASPISSEKGPTGAGAPADRPSKMRASRKLVFVWSTGRTGTKHFSTVFGSDSSVVNHQDESEHVGTKDAVDRYYRPYAATNNTQLAKKFLTSIKLPMIDKRLRQAGRANVYFQTGHVPLAFGYGELILRALGSDSFRVVRIRRDRIQQALSLMALGPESEDPWSEEVESRKRRWFPKPTDVHVKLRPSQEVWQKLNRFQKYLWLVDDTECRWQSFKRAFDFKYLEVQMEALSQLNGIEDYQRIADFVGTGIVSTPESMHRRDNSIEQKSRDHVKWVADERTLREWDESYRLEIGACILSSTEQLNWT